MRALATAVFSLAAAMAWGAERAIEKEAIVDAPVEAAFAAWSTAEGLQSFFTPEAIVNARPDGAFYIHFNPYARPGLRGADDMRVLAVQPNRMITFTWNAPPHLPEARGHKTLVIVRTDPAGEGRTRVRLAHLGWGEGGQWDEAYQYFGNAWGRVMANLERRFADKPLDWAPVLAKLKAREAEERRKQPEPADRVLRVAKVVAAPPAEVWKAFATVEGLRRWAAPVVAVDMRNGGYLRAHWDKAKTVAAPEAIHHDILTVVEGELVTYKVHLGERFGPARLQDGSLQQVVRLDPTPDGKTRVVSTMIGWGSGKEWDEAYAYYAMRNERSYEALVKAFAK